jgi:hypothetical protein
MCSYDQSIICCPDPAPIAAGIRASATHFFAIQIGCDLPTADYSNLVSWTGSTQNVYNMTNYMAIANIINNQQCDVSTSTSTSMPTTTTAGARVCQY